MNQRRLSKVVLEAAQASIHGQFNHTIARGLATSECMSLVDMLDEILRSTFSDRSLQLVYTGYSRVSPDEAALEVKKVSKSKGHDISVSDLHMVKFSFQYGEHLDKTVDKYRWNVFVRPGNQVYLGGTSYVVRPVLTDKIVSPGTESTFLRLLRDKLSISRMSYTCLLSNEKVIDMSVALMSLFRTKPKEKATSCKSTVMHYLLGQYGVTGALRVLGLPPVQVATNDTISRATGIVTYSSNTTNGSKLVFAINENDRTTSMDQFMCNVFYLLDNTPMRLEDLDSIGEWRRALGGILYGNKAPIWLTMNMQRHYETLLTSYMPPVMLKFIEMDFGDMLGDLSEEGFFKLLALTFNNFDAWMSIANEISAVAYDKRLSVNYFVLYDTITRVNRIAWELTEAKLANRLNEKVVTDCLSKYFTMRGMYKMTDKENISVQSLSHHVDTYVYKLSTAVAIQLNTGGATGAKKSGAKNPIDSTTLLHESQLSIGTLSGISAARLSPLNMLNIFARLDPITKTVIPSVHDLMHLESIREVLSRTPHRSKTGELPKLFNRFVTTPQDVPEDW